MMKKIVCYLLVFTFVFSAFSISATASTDCIDHAYSLVDGDYFIPVTKAQFDEFDENTDLEAFIEKYVLVRELAVIANPENTQTMRINRTRASINLSAHDLPRGVGTYYTDANGDPFTVKKGGSITIKATFSGHSYPGVAIGYYNVTTGHGPRTRTGATATRSESYKFTEATVVEGYMEATVPNVRVTSGSITWSR